MLISAIPSPSTGVIEVGPLNFRAYGFLIAIAVLVAVWITQRRWVARGGKADDITLLAMWTVPAGLVGARLYHVITDNQKFRGNWDDAFYIWKGGLGIWGAVAGGVLAGWWVARREGWSFGLLLDSVAPALAVAQAIGRFGNYFNQELYGRPSTLPWALRIDVENRSAQYVDFETFHPTFLYEALWNLALAAFLVFVGERLLKNYRAGRLFGLYMVGYTIGRLFIELMRSDRANEIFGQRVNVWTSLFIMAAGAFYIWTGRPRSGVDELAAEPSNEAGVDQSP
ncbi:MAG: prolipoprotein diacylglyceryl transferase [Acidimicrobiales bacterium]